MKITEVKLHNKSAGAVLEIVRELREQGLVQGEDFDFKYNHVNWNPMTGNEPAYSIFYFYTEKFATWFMLKYC
jgi:hypothetical protein